MKMCSSASNVTTCRRLLGSEIQPWCPTFQSGLVSCPP